MLKGLNEGQHIVQFQRNKVQAVKVSATFAAGGATQELKSLTKNNFDTTKSTILVVFFSLQAIKKFSFPLSLKSTYTPSHPPLDEL